MTKRGRGKHRVARPRMLAEVKMLADNLHHIPQRCREFARSLIAAEAQRGLTERQYEVRHGLTERQLRQLAKLIERIKREKARLGNGTPEPQRPGMVGSETVARRKTGDGLPRGAAKPKRSPKGRSAAAGARHAS
jgi:hypothetical protein